MKTANNTAAKIIPVVADSAAWKFTATTVALDGHTFDATYSVARNGDVYALTRIGEAGVRLHIGKGMPAYDKALEAAIAAKAAAKQPATQAESKPAEPAKPVEQPKPAAEQPAKQAADKPAKAAKQPKPEAKPAKQAVSKPAKAAKQPKAVAEPAKPVEQPKPAAEQPAKQAAPADKAWVGSTITGKGWRITFDEATQRTRVSFEGTPSASQKAAVEAAGFYYSAQLKSWNKKLTCKAYRAAMALGNTLNTIA